MRVSPVLGVVQADNDLLFWNVEPLAGHPLGARLGGEALEVGGRGAGRGAGAVALQHHVEQRLKMHGLMLEANPDGPPHMARDRIDTVYIETLEPGTHTALVGPNLIDWGPLVGY